VTNRACRAAFLLGSALLLGQPTPSAAQSGSARSGTECSLSQPLWYATAGRTTTSARGWDTGRRDDADCDFSMGGWVNATWAGNSEVQRPDGLAAPGLGAVLSTSAGVLWRRGPLEVRIMPEIAWHQNSDIAVPDSPFEDDRRYGYPWGPIDWPSRFGSDAFTLVGPGRSGVRLHTGAISIGLDAEPVRWGPSMRFPLLLSGQQASLPRVDLRTERPWDLGRFGTIDANLLYARLTSSDWFGDGTAAEDRLLAGLMLAWAPDLLPGLELGISSLHQQDLDDFDLSSAFEWVQRPAEDPEDNSVGNGIGNLWLRWSRPESGFDVWVEWLKDDYSRGIGHLFLEPEHGTGRTFGVRQEVEWGAGRFAFHFESTTTRNREPLTEDDDGERGIAYTHRQVREGHTQRGQMLGAVVGPGGDGEFFEAAFFGRTTTRIQVERLRFGTDAYTEILGDPFGDEGYDVDLVARLIHERHFGEVRAQGTVEFGSRHNRLFLAPTGEPEWEGKARVGLMLLWNR